MSGAATCVQRMQKALTQMNIQLANDELERIAGVDLTRIDGVDVMVAQTLVSEVGLVISDLSGQSAQSGYTSCGQPGGHSTATGGLDPAEKPDLSRRAVPTPAQQARRPHHQHGSPARPTGLSHAFFLRILRSNAGATARKTGSSLREPGQVIVLVGLQVPG